MNPEIETTNGQPIVWTRPPNRTPGRRVLLLIHGFSGDEHSMTIFSSKLPEDFWLYSPRAPFPASPSGYSWTQSPAEEKPGYDAYQAAARVLHEQFTHWLLENSLTALPVGVAGFSQGAALAYTLALEVPRTYDRIAGLAGFLPRGFEDPHNRLRGKEFFIAHGLRDEVVKVERARSAVDLFTAGGANVDYCEDDTTHKLSLSCFQAMARFFSAG